MKNIIIAAIPDSQSKDLKNKIHENWMMSSKIVLLAYL